MDYREDEIDPKGRRGVQIDVAEYQGRASPLAMEENLALAPELSGERLERYAQGDLAVVDLLQTLRRETDTAENLLDAYLSWRRTITRLRELTFYDFERDVPVLERFGIGVPGLELRAGAGSVQSRRAGRAGARTSRRPHRTKGVVDKRRSAR